MTIGGQLVMGGRLLVGIRIPEGFNTIVRRIPVREALRISVGFLQDLFLMDSLRISKDSLRHS